MLYKKNSVPFSAKEFANPGKEYRATPFWAWNNRLDTEELKWQIERLKELGFGGFHMHVRTGMATEYLSDEYMEIVKECVEKAREEDMLAWMYDEDRWPSGAAGGLVTKNHAYRQRYLLFSRNKADHGEQIASYDVCLNPDGSLKSYRRLHEGEAAENTAIYVSHQIAGDNPWFNNQAYLNTLDPASVQAFIHTTYDRYLDAVGEDFGGDVPAMFTDEPQFFRKGTLSYAAAQEDITLPWTPDFAKTFQDQYGEDLLDKLPELIWDLPDGQASTVRYHYHDHVAERFSSAFADQCGKWCKEHGLMLTGHMMEEPSLFSQTASLGETMRSYRAFQLPGIDMLCDRREFTTAKQAQSASRQFGREGVLSELYGVTNWNFDFRGHKLQGDWQAALGVTVRVPHLSWVSMNGEAKRDYPSTFNYQVPWYKEYPYVEDHFARLNTALTRGKPLCKVGVIHPVESYWLHWGAQQNTQAIREQMDRQFGDLTEWLLRGLVDFDFICESLLPIQQGDDAVYTDGFAVGEMHYDTVLVPPVETLRSTTVERLRKFRAAGGRVIFLGKEPKLMDAIPSEVPGQLYRDCEHQTFDRVGLLQVLGGEREIEIRDQSGAMTQNLLYQMRSEGDERWVFVCQANNPENVDVPRCQHLQIRLRGAWSLEYMNTLTGEISAFESTVENGWTVCKLPFYEEDSLLLHLKPVQETEASKAAPTSFRRSEVKRYLTPVNATLHEPNVLVLDLAEYALDDEPYAPCEEILRLDNVLRNRLGWAHRGEAYAQPWVEQDKSRPHTIRLRYHFHSEIAVNDAWLALENAEDSTVTLNGVPAQDVDGWYVDKCIGKRKLPAIPAGENVIEVSLPYGKTVDVEACYLLGDFGVRLQGCEGTLTAPVRRLAFSDMTQQGLPFYGGNLTWHIEETLEAGDYEIEASQYRGHLMKVAVAGENIGVIAFSPYKLRFHVAQAGTHKIDVTLFGSRVNTFGQIHNANKQTEWWGPNSWRTEGAEWSYEYQLWPQGVLKSVEICKLIKD